MVAIRLLSCLQPGASKIALIFLHTELNNQEISSQRKKLEILWANSIFRCGADSGCNFLRDNFSQGSNPWIPDLICGDFDSIDKATLEFYQSIPSVRVEHTPDQDATDFRKSLGLVIQEIAERNLQVDMIVAFCSGKGRFDHSMGNLSTLVSASSLSNIPVVLMSELDVQYIVPSGEKQTLILDTGTEGAYCGLIPISGPTTVTTTGLRWNLDNQVTEFGQLVSTSNEIAAPSVTILASLPVLWTMSVQPEALADNKQN